VQVVIIDVLRRAGAEVIVASVEDTLQVVETSHSLQSCSSQRRCRESWHITEHVSTVRQLINKWFVQVDMSRHVKLVADKSIQDAAQETYDAIALPVGFPTL